MDKADDTFDEGDRYAKRLLDRSHHSDCHSHSYRREMKALSKSSVNPSPDRRGDDGKPRDQMQLEGPNEFVTAFHAADVEKKGNSQPMSSKDASFSLSPGNTRQPNLSKRDSFFKRHTSSLFKNLPTPTLMSPESSVESPKKRIARPWTESGASALLPSDDVHLSESIHSIQSSSNPMTSAICNHYPEILRLEQLRLSYFINERSSDSNVLHRVFCEKEILLCKENIKNYTIGVLQNNPKNGSLYNQERLAQGQISMSRISVFVNEKKLSEQNTSYWVMVVAKEGVNTVLASNAYVVSKNELEMKFPDNCKFTHTNPDFSLIISVYRFKTENLLIEKNNRSTKSYWKCIAERTFTREDIQDKDQQIETYKFESVKSRLINDSFSGLLSFQINWNNNNFRCQAIYKKNNLNSFNCWVFFNKNTIVVIQMESQYHSIIKISNISSQKCVEITVEDSFYKEHKIRTEEKNVSTVHTFQFHCNKQYEEWNCILQSIMAIHEKWFVNGKKMSLDSEKEGQSLTDPEQYENLFPGYRESLAVEKYMEQYKKRIPASEYPNLAPNIKRNAREEWLAATGGASISSQAQVPESKNPKVSNDELSSVTQRLIDVDISKSTPPVAAVPASKPVTTSSTSRPLTVDDDDLDLDLDDVDDNIDTSDVNLDDDDILDD